MQQNSVALPMGIFSYIFGRVAVHPQLSDHMTIAFVGCISGRIKVLGEIIVRRLKGRVKPNRLHLLQCLRFALSRFFNHEVALNVKQKGQYLCHHMSVGAKKADRRGFDPKGYS